MDHIFTHLAQRLRCAFAIAQCQRVGGVVEQSLVRKALSGVGVDARAELLDRNTARFLTQDAKHVVEHALSLPTHESCALVATFSQCWDSRRLAADRLRDHYRPLLSKMIDDHNLLRAIVARHYIAERERKVSWSIGSIAHEFNIEKEKLERAASIVEQHAKVLEKAALQSLEARLNALQVHVSA